MSTRYEPNSNRHVDISSVPNYYSQLKFHHRNRSLLFTITDINTVKTQEHNPTKPASNCMLIPTFTGLEVCTTQREIKMPLRINSMFHPQTSYKKSTKNKIQVLLVAMGCGLACITIGGAIEDLHVSYSKSVTSLNRCNLQETAGYQRDSDWTQTCRLRFGCQRADVRYKTESIADCWNRTVGMTPVGPHSNIR